MRNHFSLFAFSFLVLSLAACGDNRTSGDAGGPDSHMGGDTGAGEGGVDLGPVDGGPRMDGAMDAGGDGGMTTDLGTDAPMGDGGGDGGTMSCADGDLGMMVGVAIRTGDTSAATTSLMPSCNAGAAAPGLRFSWTAPASGMYTIDTLGSAYDTVIALLDTTCTGTELDCNDDTPVGSDSTSRIDTTVTAGHVYVIAVTGYDAATGAFTLSITQPTADETGLCHDGMDNDRDGAADCADSDCSADPTCTETNCTNGLDDDMDGAIDCADSDCSALPICVAPNCGNGITDTGETCDDSNGTNGDGCSSVCQIEPLYTCAGSPSVCTSTCGNGTVDAATGEECDDGNTVDGDRCSALCVLEFTIDEFENNDTAAAATTVADGDRVHGTFDTATDVDIFTFTLTTPAQLDLEAYTTIDGSLANYDGMGTLGPRVDCPTADTVVRLFSDTGDVTMDATALASDDNNGDGNCSFLGAADSTAIYLAPGTYFIKVVSTAGALIPLYILDVKLTPAVAPVAASLLINEVMANPGAAAAAVDTNCDGTGSSNDDEFVEIVNTTATFLDLTGVTVSDLLATPTVRHTFARGLSPHAAVVVYGGGASMCAGVDGEISTAGTLGLNNSAPGDGVTLTGPTGTVLASMTYVTTTAGVSRNLSPDLNLTGTYALHNAIAGAVGNFSPGKRVDGTAF